jgi:hypothetical protein
MYIWENTLEKLLTNLGDLEKLRFLKVFLQCLSFWLQSTRISLVKILWNLIFEYFAEICGEKSSFVEIR